MLPLLGGFAILCGLLLLGYLFVNADPARLARIVKWTAIVLAVLAVIALIWSERFAMFLAPWRRIRSLMSGLRGPSPARDSTVETRFIRMTLDHDTGTMSGTVLEGRFAGMRLEELRPAELLALLRECRAEDEEAARLLEAYLDRVRSNWHDEMAGEEGWTSPPPSGTDYLATKINRARDVLLHH